MNACHCASPSFGIFEKTLVQIADRVARANASRLLRESDLRAPAREALVYDDSVAGAAESRTAAESDDDAASSSRSAAGGDAADGDAADGDGGDDPAQRAMAALGEINESALKEVLSDEQTRRMDAQMALVPTDVEGAARAQIAAEIGQALMRSFDGAQREAFRSLAYAKLQVAVWSGALPDERIADMFMAQMSAQMGVAEDEPTTVAT